MCVFVSMCAYECVSYLVLNVFCLFVSGCLNQQIVPPAGPPVTGRAARGTYLLNGERA